MLFLSMTFLLFFLILYNLKPNPTHSSTDTSHTVTSVLLFGALQCIVWLAKTLNIKEEERKDKDMPLKIVSIFSFDNFNNVYITVLENQ